MIEFEKITNEEQVKNFIDSCSDELKTFRYYNSRPLNVYKSHLYSFIIYCEKIPIAYYHVEKENDVIWFGICILKKYQKTGLGTLIMNHMIYCAKLMELKNINLAVDIDNHAAINLYVKFGFKVKQVNKNIFKMIKEF